MGFNLATALRKINLGGVIPGRAPAREPGIQATVQ